MGRSGIFWLNISSIEQAARCTFLRVQVRWIRLGREFRESQRSGLTTSEKQRCETKRVLSRPLIRILFLSRGYPNGKSMRKESSAA